MLVYQRVIIINHTDHTFCYSLPSLPNPWTRWRLYWENLWTNMGGFRCHVWLPEGTPVSMPDVESLEFVCYDLHPSYTPLNVPNLSVLHTFSIFQQKPPQAPQPPSPLGFKSSSGCQFFAMRLDSCWTIPHICFHHFPLKSCPAAGPKGSELRRARKPPKAGSAAWATSCPSKNRDLSPGGCKAKSEKIDEQFITILCGSLLFYLLVGCYISCFIPIISACLVVKYSRIFVFSMVKSW